MLDLAGDRDVRREQQGYVSPAQARAFMQAARHVQLDNRGRRTARWRAPISASSRRPQARTTTRPDVRPARLPSPPSDTRDTAPAAMAEVMEVLRDAGVLVDAPRGLLSSPRHDAGRLALIQHFVASKPAGQEELAYLTNAIIAGCSILARPFAPQEASNAALAICNLGLEAWPPHWNDVDLVTAFQVGWSILHRDVAMYAAKRLIAVIGDIQCDDRDTRLRLQGLRRDLVRHVRDGAPWRARNALDAILILDASCWAALVALTDECPVLHAAIRASHDRVRSINPAGYEFISQLSQIAVVREFMASLPTRLA